MGNRSASRKYKELKDQDEQVEPKYRKVAITRDVETTDESFFGTGSRKLFADSDTATGYEGLAEASIKKSYSSKTQIALVEKEKQQVVDAADAAFATCTKGFTTAEDVTAQSRKLSGPFTTWLGATMRVLKGDKGKLDTAVSTQIEKVAGQIETLVETATVGEGEDARANAEQVLDQAWTSFQAAVVKTVLAAFKKAKDPANTIVYLGVKLALDTLGVVPSSKEKSDAWEVIQAAYTGAAETEKVLAAARAMSKEAFDESLDRMRDGMSVEVAELLDGEDHEAGNPDASRMARISDLLGSSVSVAGAAADALKYIDELRTLDPTITEEHGAEFEAKIAAYGTTVAECNGFVDGMTLLLDSGFACFVSGKVHFSAEARLSESFKAQVAAQAEAYLGAEGSVKLLATLSLAEGLELLADVSFQAKAVATASVTTKLTLGPIYLEASASVEAKASVEASASGRFAIKPDGTVVLTGSANFLLGASVTATGKAESNFFSVEASVSANVGLGASLGGSFLMEGGKLTLSIDIGATLGLGATGTLALEIDFKALLEAIARQVEAYLTKRWKHRHKKFGQPPLREAKKVEDLADDVALAIDNSAFDLPAIPQKHRAGGYVELAEELEPDAHFVAMVKSAERRLPVGTDEAAFHAELDLFVKGFWKRHTKLRSKALKGKVDTDQISIDDLIAEELEALWEVFNERFATVINKKYGDVFLTRFAPTGSIEELSELDVPAGSFSVVPITADVGVALDAAALLIASLDVREGGLGPNQLKRLADLIERHGLNMNKASKLSSSIDSIVAVFWEGDSNYKLLKEVHSNDWKRFKPTFFAGGNPGGVSSLCMAVVFTKVAAGQYVVSVPRSGKKHPYSVRAITEDRISDRHDALQVQLRAVFQNLFQPILRGDGKTDTTLANRTEAGWLYDAGIPQARALAEGMKDLESKKEGLSSPALDTVYAGLDSTDTKTTLSKLTSLAGRVKIHIDAMDTARAELLDLAKTIKAIDIEEPTHFGKLKEADASHQALRKQHAQALEADTENGATTASALDRACEVLLGLRSEGLVKGVRNQELRECLEDLAALHKRARAMSDRWALVDVELQLELLRALEERVPNGLSNADTYVKELFASAKALLTELRSSLEPEDHE